MHLLNESNEQVRVVQGCKWHFLIISVKHLPLVESDRIALQTTENKLLQHHYFYLCLATVTDLICLYWPGLHVEIPDFDSQVVAGHHVASAVAELYVGDGWDDFRKEWTVVWILWLFKHLKEKDKGCMSLVYPDWNEVFIQLWIHSGGNNVVITAALLSKTKKKKSIRKVTLWVLALKEKKKADIDRQRNKGWIPPPLLIR